MVPDRYAIKDLKFTHFITDKAGKPYAAAYKQLLLKIYQKTVISRCEHNSHFFTL